MKENIGSQFISKNYSTQKFLPTILFLSLFIIDITIRSVAAFNNTNFLSGDALAPFSLFDQFYHNEAVDVSRQMWLLPWISAKIIQLFNHDLSYHTLFALYNIFTALAASLTLPILYLLSLRFLTPYGALIPVVLLSINTSFFLESIFNNPTQVYALCMTLVTLCLVNFDRWPIRMAILAAFSAGVGFLIRWEGILLLSLVTIFLFWEGWHKRFSILIAGIIGFIALGLIFKTIILHISLSTSPFAFLANTNAVAAPFSLLHMNLQQLTELLVRSLSWKLEKLNALSVNLTLLGIILGTIGALVAAEKRPIVLFPIVYWIGYEATMFLFTLIVPVGSSDYLSFTTNLNTLPVDRYYQIFTPVFLLLICLGSKHLLELLPRIRFLKSTIAVSVIALFAIQQIYITSYTYFNQYYSYARNSSLNEILSLAEYFRTQHVRDKDIGIVRYDKLTLKYSNNFESSFKDYTLHCFHFSILSGHNRTNCTGYNLVNPNLFCSVLSKTDIVELNKTPLGIHFNYLILLKPNNSQIPAGFHIAFENSIASILEPS